MNRLPTPHDALFKQFLMDASIARDFLEAHLSAHLKKHCDFTTLELVPGSFVEPELRQHFSDIVYSMQIADKLGYVYVLIEHESTAQKLAPFKLLRYQISIMKQHLEQGHLRLPVVIPLLFYRGLESPYPGNIDLFDCFENKALAQEVFLKPIKLIDLSVIPDEELRTHQSVAALELVQKHIRARDVMQFAQYMLELLSLKPLSVEHVRSLLYYLLKEGECADYTQFVRLIAEHATEYQEEIMTIAQQLRQEGERRKAIMVAENMLAEGIDPSITQKVTGLSDKKMASLISKLKH